MKPLFNTFEVASGSVIGLEHLRTGKNNQDACAHAWSPQGMVAVVCDGCGSSAHSEVGAHLGTQLVIATLERSLSQTHPDQNPEFWLQLHQDLLHGLRLCISPLQNLQTDLIWHYFLFTVVAALITPESTWLFSLGDGTLVVNGEVLSLGPFPRNAPPYLAYGLVPEAVDLDQNQLRLQVHRHLPTAELQSLLIGSDGVQDLITAADKPLPGKTEPVGALAQFWQSDRYFQNPDAIRRRLSLINRTTTHADWDSRQLHRHSGLLPDDTTLLTIRRQFSG